MDIYYIISALAGVVAILTALTYVVKHFRKANGKLDLFLDDWYGKPARPDEGVPQTKGVMLRLKEQDDTLAFLKHELSMNGSKSVKDVVNQSAVDLSNVKKDIAQVKTQIEKLSTQVRDK